MLISERIYEYLDKRGMTQLEFSKKTGISQSTISDWRRKGTNPSADKIMIICEVLDVSPYELLQGTENEKHKEYRQPDYIVVDRNSNLAVLIESFNKMDLEQKKKLEAYAKKIAEEK